MTENAINDLIYILSCSTAETYWNAKLSGFMSKYPRNVSVLNVVLKEVAF